LRFNRSNEAKRAMIDNSVDNGLGNIGESQVIAFLKVLYAALSTKASSS